MIKQGNLNPLEKFLGLVLIRLRIERKFAIMRNIVNYDEYTCTINF